MLRQDKAEESGPAKVKTTEKLTITSGLPPGINIYRVWSEPGDATRYEYFVIENGDDYFFTPIKMSFFYPQHLAFWDVKGWDGSVEQAKQFSQGSNAYTVAECIRTIFELRMSRLRGK